MSLGYYMQFDAYIVLIKEKFIASIHKICNLINKDIVFIGCIYFLSYFFFILNRGIYWDDWTLINVNRVIIIDTFIQAGHPWTGYLHSYLLSLNNSITFYRIIIFLSYLLSSIFLYYFLSSISIIDNHSRLFIVLFFSLFPVNNFRLTLILAPLAICYFFFFFGLFSISIFFKARKLKFRIISLSIFYISFMVQSFLFFYLIVFLYIVYKEKINLLSIKDTISVIKKYLDFFILPLLFFTIKIIYFKPYGFYQGYTSLTGVLNPIKIIYNSFLSFYYSFIDVIIKVFPNKIVLLILIVSISGVFAYFFNQKYLDFNSKAKNINYLFFLGIFLFLIAIFPYLAVGKGAPNLNDMNSRDQLLVPLGASFMLYYGIKIVLNKVKLKNISHIFIFSFLIFSLIFANISNYSDIQKDWYKQCSLIENFRDSDILKNNSTFLFIDNTLDMNKNKRTYRFYEYSGMMKYVFKDETRFGANKQNFNNIDDYQRYFSEHYNLKEYSPQKEQFEIIIDYGDLRLNNYIDILRLMWLEYFNQDIFQEEIKKIVKLSYIKIE